MLPKGFETGLSKQQVSNVFANQEALHAANISPLTAIDTFSGARSGKIRHDFYDDCQDIPDSSTLDPIKPSRSTLEEDTSTVIHCTKLLPSTPTYSSREFKLHYLVPTRCKESNTYKC